MKRWSPRASLVTLAPWALTLAVSSPALAQTSTTTFTVDSTASINSATIIPADTLRAPGGVASVYQSASSLGLVTSTPSSGSFDAINSLSFGSDPTSGNSLHLFFSVDSVSLGLAGTAVNDAFLGDGASGNVYAADLGGSNTLFAGHASLGLAGTDNLVGLELDGAPNPFTFFTLDATSPTLTTLGVTGGSILVSTGDGTSLSIFATAADLGLGAGDVIDGLILDDANGDGLWDAGDSALFSLTSLSSGVFTSTTGGTYGDAYGSFSAADVLSIRYGGTLGRFATAADLGLDALDNLVGLDARIVPVPEPSAAWLVGLGLGVVAAARRRRPSA